MLIVKLNPIMVHSVSSVRIPHSVNDLTSFPPSVRIRLLNLYSASNVHLYGLSNFNVLRNNSFIRLSPIRSSILRKYSNPFKRPRMNPNVSKCTKPFVLPLMFLSSVINNSELTIHGSHTILTWKTINCNMQYVGQT